MNIKAIRYLELAIELFTDLPADGKCETIVALKLTHGDRAHKTLLILRLYVEKVQLVVILVVVSVKIYIANKYDSLVIIFLLLQPLTRILLFTNGPFELFFT